MQIPTYGPAPTIAPSGAPGTYQSIQTNGDEFGAGIGQSALGVGQALQHAANQTFETGLKAQAIENKTAAKDLVYNQYLPAQNAILFGTSDKPGYYGKTGQDALSSREATTKALTDLHANLIGSISNPAVKSMVEDFVTPEMRRGLDGISSHASKEFLTYRDTVSRASTESALNNAVLHYSDPDQFGTYLDRASNEALSNAKAQGIQDPAALDTIASGIRAKGVEAGVMRFLTNNDPDGARGFYEQHKAVLRGNALLDVEQKLHATNTAALGQANGAALLGGQPLPDRPTALGVPRAQVQSALIGAAKSSGADPSHALTVAEIESSTGSNLGTIGNLGQIKGGTTKAGDVAGQARDLCAEWQRVGPIADQAVGGTAQPWQRYVVYQQGQGGGPALLQADAKDNAVDVLAPLYKSRDIAQSAITGNGGRPDMTAGQFLDFLQSKWNQNARRCAVDPNAPATAPATPLMAPQPATNPHQALIEFDKVYAPALDRANAIPNLAERDATVHYLETQKAVRTQAAAAWTQQTTDALMKLGMDPKFTNISQVPPDMVPAMSENPHMAIWLENRAKSNAGGGDSKSFDDNAKAVYYDALGKMANDRKGFAAENLTDPKYSHALPDNYLHELMNKQFVIRENLNSGDTEVSPRLLSSAKSIAHPMLEAAGIKTQVTDKSPDNVKQTYNQFIGRLTSDLQDYKIAHKGDDPDAVGMRSIVSSLLTQGLQRDSGWIWDREVRNFQVSPDQFYLKPAAAELPDLRRRFLAANGRLPKTDDELVRAYTKWKTLTGGAK